MPEVAAPPGPGFVHQQQANRATELQKRQSCNVSTRRSDDLFRKRLPIRPHGAVHKLFVLPDRDGLLQRVDYPAARVKRRAPVRRSHRDQHTRLAHHQSPQPVHNRHLAHPELRDRLRPKLAASASAPSPHTPHSPGAPSRGPAYCRARCRQTRTPRHRHRPSPPPRSPPSQSAPAQSPPAHRPLRSPAAESQPHPHPPAPARPARTHDSQPPPPTAARPPETALRSSSASSRSPTELRVSTSRTSPPSGSSVRQGPNDTNRIRTPVGRIPRAYVRPTAEPHSAGPSGCVISTSTRSVISASPPMRHLDRSETASSFRAAERPPCFAGATVHLARA